MNTGCRHRFDTLISFLFCMLTQQDQGWTRDWLHGRGAPGTHIQLALCTAELVEGVDNNEEAYRSYLKTGVPGNEAAKDGLYQGQAVEMGWPACAHGLGGVDRVSPRIRLTLLQNLWKSSRKMCSVRKLHDFQYVCNERSSSFKCSFPMNTPSESFMSCSSSNGPNRQWQEMLRLYIVCSKAQWSDHIC